MANRFFSPSEQFVNSAGVPYSGGTLSFYVSGTSTPQNTYSNQALSIPNPNPVTLDSAGRAGAVFLNNAAYKVVLADALSNVIWTQDPVYTSDYSTPGAFLIFAGNPNGSVAGIQGAGSVPASVIWDSADNLLFVCTTTGSSITAVWTAINTAGNSVTPTGTVLSYAGSTAPASFLLCSGGSFSRTTFATLFGIIGVIYGSVDGSHFNVPDLRGRTPYGVDNMGGATAGRITAAGGNFDGTGLGNVGGLENHVLIPGEMPTHNHGVSDPAHTHTVSDPGHNHTITDSGHIHAITDAGHQHNLPNQINNTSGGGAQGGTVAGASYASSSLLVANNTTGITINSHATGIVNVANFTGNTNQASFTGITTINTGGSTLHTVLNPALILNYIIKT